MSPNALTTTERAIAYLQRGQGIEDFAKPLIPAIVNSVTGKFENLTGRRLAARVYRAEVSLSGCTTLQGDETVTGSGFSALKVFDDAVYSRLPLGTRIRSITSDSSLELTKQAKSASGAGNATIIFGSAPLVIDGDGECVAWAPERPLHAVYSIKRLDSFGLLTPLDLTNMRTVKETGEIYLPNDWFPKGTSNVQIECLAGYKPPSEDNADLGDAEAWAELESLAWRAIQVGFQDFMQLAGRTGELQVAQATQRVQSFRLPDDIRQGLAQFRRLW